MKIAGEIYFGSWLSPGWLTPRPDGMAQWPDRPEESRSLQGGPEVESKGRNPGSGCDVRATPHARPFCPDSTPNSKSALAGDSGHLLLVHKQQPTHEECGLRSLVNSSGRLLRGEEGWAGACGVEGIITLACLRLGGGSQRTSCVWWPLVPQPSRGLSWPRDPGPGNAKSWWRLVLCYSSFPGIAGIVGFAGLCLLNPTHVLYY